MIAQARAQEVLTIHKCACVPCDWAARHIDCVACFAMYALAPKTRLTPFTKQVRRSKIFASFWCHFAVCRACSTPGRLMDMRGHDKHADEYFSAPHTSLDLVALSVTATCR